MVISGHRLRVSILPAGRVQPSPGTDGLTGTGIGIETCGVMTRLSMGPSGPIEFQEHHSQDRD